MVIESLMETGSNLCFPVVGPHQSVTCLFTHWPSACPAACFGTHFITSSLRPFLFCAVPWGCLGLFTCLHYSITRPRACPSLRQAHPPGSSLHGILQPRILEWVAMLSSRGSSQPRDQTQVPFTTGRFFTIWATREAPMSRVRCNNPHGVIRRVKGISGP